jgi:hypothetical protein
MAHSALRSKLSTATVVGNWSSNVRSKLCSKRALLSQWYKLELSRCLSGVMIDSAPMNRHSGKEQGEFGLTVIYTNKQSAKR